MSHKKLIVVGINSDLLVNQLSKVGGCRGGGAGKGALICVCQYLWLNKIFPPWQVSASLDTKLVGLEHTHLSETGISRV